LLSSFFLPAAKLYPAGAGNDAIRRTMLPRVLDQSATRLHQSLLQTRQRPVTP
jgi:hypothetical protein